MTSSPRHRPQPRQGLSLAALSPPRHRTGTAEHHRIRCGNPSLHPGITDKLPSPYDRLPPQRNRPSSRTASASRCITTGTRQC